MNGSSFNISFNLGYFTFIFFFFFKFDHQNVDFFSQLRFLQNLLEIQVAPALDFFINYLVLGILFCSKMIIAGTKLILGADIGVVF